MKKDVYLSDKKFFNISIGKRVLKSEIFNSSGKIPLFSSNVNEPFGFLEDSNIVDFGQDSILWGIDGNFEFSIMRKGVKFATTDHCGMIRILHKKILPEYVLYYLDLQKVILGFDRSLRSSLENMGNVSIKIPLDENHDFDIDKQKEIIQKYILIKQIKEDLQSQINELEGVVLDIRNSGKTKPLKIYDIFDLNQTTNRSDFTKSFVNSNKGDIPVYSASKNESSINYGFVMDKIPKIKYFKDILTWNIDGSVGKAFFRAGKFSLSEKVIPLILREKLKNQIDLYFIKYMIEKKAIEHGFAFTNKAGKTRIKEIEVDVPQKENGELDIDKQKEIAEKYSMAYKIRSKLIETLQDLMDSSIEI